MPGPDLRLTDSEPLAFLRKYLLGTYAVPHPVLDTGNSGVSKRCLFYHAVYILGVGAGGSWEETLNKYNLASNKGYTEKF